MVIKFIRLAWLPWLGSLAFFAFAFAGVFAFVTGGSTLPDLLGLAASVLVVATPVSLFLGMPAAFFAWRRLQYNRRVLPLWKVGLIGFAAGTLLHTGMLLLLGAWTEFPQILFFTCLCGGGLGCLFSIWFAKRGGLTPLDAANANREKIDLTA